jgi:catechol 2,3-dioxygenase-like lactoylglutathione lyase family enzyme
MIERLSHITVYVEDSAAARRFYLGVLGFVPVVDKDLGAWRWVTVSPAKQREIQLVLVQIDTQPQLVNEARAHIRALLRAHALPAITLRTAACQAAYEELRARGVEFAYPPAPQFFGVETTFYDPDGNAFSLVQTPADS